MSTKFTKTALRQPFFKASAFKVNDDGTISSTKSCNCTSLSSSPLSTEVLRELEVVTTRNWPGPKIFFVCIAKTFRQFWKVRKRKERKERVKIVNRLKLKVILMNRINKFQVQEYPMMKYTICQIDLTGLVFRNPVVL